jgi:hypothetical protein
LRDQFARTPCSLRAQAMEAERFFASLRMTNFH